MARYHLLFLVSCSTVRHRALAFIAPDIRTHWQLSAANLRRCLAGRWGLQPALYTMPDRWRDQRPQAVIELCVALFGTVTPAPPAPDIETTVLLRFLTGLGLGGATIPSP